MKIGIPLSHHAYTPEAYAYEAFLSKQGWQVQLDYHLDPNNDINIHFMGMRPFWKSSRGKAIEVHEYQSLSTAPYAHAKDWLKSHLNTKPNARIFLNPFVSKQLHFQDKLPYLYRDMGIDDNLFQQPSAQPLYDVLYCGSIQNRQGLVDTIVHLAQMGMRIVVVGTVADDIATVLNQYHNIHLTGRLPRSDLPAVYRECRFGLNYTPDIYPFHGQTSTKTLEYLASGLQLISNRYTWIEQFCQQHQIQPIWLGELNNPATLSDYPTNRVDLEAYRWEQLLNRVQFVDFLTALAP